MKRSALHFVLSMALFLAAACPAFAGGGGEIFTREVMLKAMAQNCIVPGMVELAASADGLYRAAQKLMDKPNRKALDQARASWTKMQLTYKRYEMLSYGPVENEIFWRANFYQMTHPGLTEYTITNKEPIDAKLIERIGGSARGFSAAEYLLFAPLSAQIKKAGLDGKSESATNSFVSWFLQGKTAARRRQYLCAVTRDLSQHLQAAARKAQDPKFPAEFAAGGQDSVNLLVNQLFATLESNITAPLQLALNPVFAKRTGLSAEKISGMKVSLDGLHRFYEGAGGVGINDYLRRTNPGLNERLEAQFKSTAAALAILIKPVETMGVKQRPPVEKALEETRKLELLLKVDLVSAMGVTIMFHGYDGD